MVLLLSANPPCDALLKSVLSEAGPSKQTNGCDAWKRRSTRGHFLGQVHSSDGLAKLDLVRIMQACKRTKPIKGKCTSLHMQKSSVEYLHSDLLPITIYKFDFVCTLKLIEVRRCDVCGSNLR